MANNDTTNGVWRTIGGRKVFIKNGQSLSEAMIESGKFKNIREDYRKAKEEEKKKHEPKYDSVVDRYEKDEDFRNMLKGEHKKTLEATEKEIQSYFDLPLAEREEIGDKDDLYKYINDNYYNIDRENFDKIYDEKLKEFVAKDIAKSFGASEVKVNGKIIDLKNENVGKNRTYEEIDKEWKETQAKLEKDYEEFGTTNWKDEKRLNELSRERDVAQFKTDDAAVKESAKKWSDTVKAYYKQAGVDVDKNIAKVKDRKLAKSIDPNYESKADVENDLKWFETMEKEHPGKGLENNEEYQALKSDYESVYKTKWNGATNESMNDKIRKKAKKGKK